jgi:hypothetical protein
MKPICTLAMAALATSSVLAAGEVSLLADKQFGVAQTANQVLFGSTHGSFDAIRPAGYALRVGVSLIDAKVVELSADATYHPKTETDVVFAGVSLNQKYSNQYMAVGAKVEWKLLVNLYAGLEVRSEKLEFASESVTYTRPWLRAGVGMNLPIPVASPFIRLEFAMATTKESRMTDASTALKALAPQYQVALNVGVHF